MSDAEVARRCRFVGRDAANGDADARDARRKLVPPVYDDPIAADASENVPYVRLLPRGEEVYATASTLAASERRPPPRVGVRERDLPRSKSGKSASLKASSEREDALGGERERGRGDAEGCRPRCGGAGGVGVDMVRWVIEREVRLNSCAPRR